jgi:hypothetical protein
MEVDHLREFSFDPLSRMKNGIDLALGETRFLSDCRDTRKAHALIIRIVRQGEEHEEPSALIR